MKGLYPLKFHPVFKDKIWGGNKIKTLLNKDFYPLPNCGETWELSSVEGNISVVSNGWLKGRPINKVIEEFNDRLMGKTCYQNHGSSFPLLIKFIDANADLSIQVHPDDALARARHGSFGKTEMWYVMQADEGSSLISGFDREMTRDKYLDFFEKGRLTEVLNREEAKKGDVFFVPAGRVHTIGKGLLIAEIQQTSDVTYRIYDFDRKDDHGNLRELHVEEALDAIDYSFHEQYKTTYDLSENVPTRVADCEYFTVDILSVNHRVYRDYSHISSFLALIVTEGSMKLAGDFGEEFVEAGDVVLLPAEFEGVDLEPDKTCKFLETYIKKD